MVGAILRPGNCARFSCDNSRQKWVIRVTGANEISTWSRFAGVTLRPWSGTSPTSLIVRGVISLVVSAGLAYIFIQILNPNSDVGGMGTDGLAFLKSVLIPAAIVAGIMALYAILRIVVGALDLIPRRSVHGTVVSLGERRVGDFLPQVLQRQLWDLVNSSGHDRRRTRTELVLSTAQGTRSWTLRNRRLEPVLTVGRPVTISVSPLVGYVADARPR